MNGYWKAEQNYHYAAGNINFDRQIDEIFGDYMMYVDSLEKKSTKQKNDMRAAARKWKKKIADDKLFESYYEIYRHACTAMDDEKRRKQAKQAAAEAGSGSSGSDDGDHASDSDFQM